MAGIGGALMCEMWERSSSDDGLTPASRALIVRVTSAGSLLAVAAVAVQTAVHGLNAMLTDGGYWSVNSENNPIAWAHAAAIVSSAFVCALHALLVEQRRITFTVAAVLLAFLSVDEAIQVHERIIGRVLDWTERSATWDSVLWPIVYLPICAVLAWALWRVSDEAPWPAARLLVGGLGLLVVAVLAEMVSAPWSDEDGVQFTRSRGPSRRLPSSPAGSPSPPVSPRCFSATSPWRSAPCPARSPKRARARTERPPGKSRDGEIRTPDPLLPKQVRCQAAPHPEKPLRRAP
jgi:hypothetical protein